MIKIKKSPTADSRTAVGNPTMEELLNSSISHIGDVQQALSWICSQLTEAGKNHDHTKLTGIEDFYDSFSRKLKDEEFKKEKWWKSHMKERHHLNDSCPDDVTLIDVMEQIADITTAGMARSGKVYSDDLNNEILQKAYKNTVELLKKNIKVED
jgi:hypothetical protein